MPKVTEQHRLARQDEIIAAALAAFRRKGFQATSMAEIIAESGLSAGAIYGYFPSKADIIYAVATKIVGARIVDLDNLARVEPMPEPAVMLRTLLQGLIDNLGFPAILLQVWGEAVTDDRLRELCVEIFSRLRDAVTLYIVLWQQSAHGASEQEAQRIAKDQVPLFISVVNGFVVQDSLVTGFDRDAYLAATLPYLPK